MAVTRFGAAWASQHAGPRKILRACVGPCIAGIGLFIACAALGSQMLGVAAVALLGPALGPILPTTLALLRPAFLDRSGTTTGLIFAVGSVGGAVVPWAIGALIVNLGPVVTTTILLSLPIAMALLLAALGRWIKRPEPAPTRLK